MNKVKKSLSETKINFLQAYGVKNVHDIGLPTDNGKLTNICLLIFDIFVIRKRITVSTRNVHFMSNYHFTYMVKYSNYFDSI